MDELHELMSEVQEIKPHQVEKRELQEFKPLGSVKREPHELLPEIQEIKPLRIVKREPLKEKVSQIQAKVEVPKPLQKEAGSLKPSKNRVLIRRQAILGAFSPGTDKNVATNQESLSLARGGHIIADSELIREIGNEKNEQFTRWTEAFEKVYEVKFQTVKDDLTEAPKAVIGAYDLRVDISMLDFWQEGEGLEEREIVKKGCTQIIGRWERWLTAGKTGSEPDFGEDLAWVTWQRLRC